MVRSSHSFCISQRLIFTSSTGYMKLLFIPQYMSGTESYQSFESLSNSPDASLAEPLYSHRKKRSDESSIEEVELHLGLEIKSHRSAVAQEHRQDCCHWWWWVVVLGESALSWDRDCLNSARPIPILFQPHHDEGEYYHQQGRRMRRDLCTVSLHQHHRLSGCSNFMDPDNRLSRLVSHR